MRKAQDSTVEAKIDKQHLSGMRLRHAQYERLEEIVTKKRYARSVRQIVENVMKWWLQQPDAQQRAIYMSAEENAIAEQIKSPPVHGSGPD